MGRHSIPEQAQFVGEWALPGADEAARAIPGTLSWSSKRATLKLHHTFKELNGAIYGDEVHQYEALHGKTIDSQFVTMLKASGGSPGFSLGPTGVRQPQTLVSSWVVVGAHVDSQTRYNEIRVRIPGLELWLGRSGIEQSFFTKTDQSPAGAAYVINGVPEETISIPSAGITIGWSFDRNFGGNLATDISVRTSACLRLESDEPQNLDWFLAQLRKATTLLAFIAGSPMAPDRITAKIEKHGPEVEILIALRESKCCTYRSETDFYMLRENMNVTLGAVFSKWYEIYETVAMPSQLALSVLSSEGLWLHVEFLSHLQTLEGLHRATAFGLYVEPEKYEAIRQAISNAIPPSIESDHRDALKARIKYGNEVSLRKRLDSLVHRLQLPLRKWILAGDGSVPHRWIDTRNYYTHWDETSRESVLDGLSMHLAHVRMRHLIRALFLDLAGIPQGAIAKTLRNTCKESQYLIQINNALYRAKNPDDTSTAIMHVNVVEADRSNEPAE